MFRTFGDQDHPFQNLPAAHEPVVCMVLALALTHVRTTFVLHGLRHERLSGFREGLNPLFLHSP